MEWNRPYSWWRRPAALAAMLLFVVGSNYCLLSALVGTPMACLSPPGAAASTTSSHCGHPSPAKDQGGAGPHMVSPCCVTVAQVAAPQVDKPQAVESLFLPLQHPGPALLVMVPTGRVPLDSDESPPTRLDLPAQHLGRAPPLA